MQVNIKQELSKLDRNNFTAVSDLVDKIILDLIIIGDEVMWDAVKDYMIDLINPDLLDFNNENL